MWKKRCDIRGTSHQIFTSTDNGIAITLNRRQAVRNCGLNQPQKATKKPTIMKVMALAGGDTPPTPNAASAKKAEYRTPFRVIPRQAIAIRSGVSAYGMRMTDVSL